MSHKKRIVVAMSGGVDSSTAAALLVEAGHEVIGLAMKTHDGAVRGSRACCTPDDMRDARRVANLLKIPFYVLNYTELFHTAVMAPFAAAYQAGETPNPCVVCNDKVKFDPLLARARLLQADFLATGHYARLLTCGGRHFLQRARDANKDQSYFLYRLRQEQMAALLLPLGNMCKDEVRAHAARLGLPVAAKAESQEICFVGAEGYAKTVERLGGAGRAGRLLDAQGKVVGEHAGVHHFTLGQRRGLRIAAPEPLYVTSIDAQSGDVQLGAATALNSTFVRLRDVVWTAGAPAAHCTVRLLQRYRDAGTLAQVAPGRAPGEARALLHLVQPARRGAPGQAAVLYARLHATGVASVSAADALLETDGTAHQDEVVLGGGIITAPVTSPTPSVARHKSVAAPPVTQGVASC